MSKAECPGKVPATRCHFKGVENFLKRIAFNLGNSPSQTEVKIISCIPIDVSDLQQKILSLEKQIEETRCYRVCTPQRPINTCECPPVNTGVTCNLLDIDRGTNPMRRRRVSLKKKSNVSFGQPCNNSSCSCAQRDRMFLVEKLFDNDLSNNTVTAYPATETHSPEVETNFFKKKKRWLCRKPKSQAVYYAQTKSNPFNDPSKKLEAIPKKNKVMSRSYLAEMINKQYRPRPLGGNLSQISNFSAPICRDSQDYKRLISFYESDLCSCFHEGFHNIDKHLDMNQNHSPYAYRSNELTKERGYYDSTLYDVVPVKEKPVKNKKYLDNTKKREPRHCVNVKSLPEDLFTNVGSYPIYNEYDNDIIIHRPENNFSKLAKRRELVPPVKNIARRRNKLQNVDRGINMQESKSCCIDFGKTQHSRILIQKPKEDKRLNTQQIPLKIDAECLTTALNNSGCQTGSNVVDTNTDLKTEKTLHQIKSILQSVLQEVKVTGTPKVNAETRKESDIQKDVSQNIASGVHQGNSPGSLHSNNRESVQAAMDNNFKRNMASSLFANTPGSQQSYMPSNFSGGIPTMQTPAYMQGSRLLNSFSYNPYNQCMPSCSKQIYSNHYCYTPPAVKYFQNYPLLVPNPERHLCTTCYRHNSHFKPNHDKRAMTIATNTDHIDTTEPRKETNTLIKEIYKSMVVNVSDTNKHHSLSEIAVKQCTKPSTKKPTEIKKVEQKPELKDAKKPTTVMHAVSELFRKKDMPVSSDSPIVTISTTQESTFNSTSSQIVNNAAIKTDRGKMTMPSTSEEYHQEQQKCDYRARGESGVSTNTETEETATETETEEVSVSERPKHVQISRGKKEKSNIFSKMMNSVKLFKQRDKQKSNKQEYSVETEESEELSSDSDDYQTIYSQKINKPVKHTPRTQIFPRRRTHSKISYKQVYQTDRNTLNVKRSPYMEQEYRRQWDENLMFGSNNEWQSSDRPSYTYEYSSESRKPFNQSYEARTALVQPQKLVVEPMNAKRVVLSNKVSKKDPKSTSKRLSWFKNHKMGLECNKEHWKKLVVNN